MKDQDFETIFIGDRTIVVKGIGKMFYQDGFPIAMSVSFFRSKGFEPSLLHIADELLKNGWSAERVCRTIETSFQEDIETGIHDYDSLQVQHFCFSTYEGQREMIFDYLFGGNREMAKGFLLNAIKLDTNEPT